MCLGLQLFKLVCPRKSRLLIFFLNSVLYLCMSAVCWRTVFQLFLLLSVLASGNISSLCNLVGFQGCFSSIEISPVLLFYPCACYKLR